MARQFAGRHQDGVEAHVSYARLRKGGKPGLRRGGDAAALLFGHRFGGVVERGARLDLDKDQQVPRAPR